MVIDQTLAKTAQPTGDANSSGLRLQDLTKSDINALVYAA
jgi:hypothetical protein